MFLDRVIHFGKNLGDHVKVRFPKRLKSFIEVPYVADLKIQVLSLNMNLFYSSSRVPRPSSSFWEKIGISGKMLFTEKAKIIDRDYQSRSLESTGCKLQYEPYLFSVACS